MSSPINDGYTIKATIPARGPWEELHFTYRPLLAHDVCEFMDNPKKGTNRLKSIVKILAKQLVNWDVAPPGGCDPSIINEDNLSKMPMYHLDMMMDAVLSYSALEQEIDEKN